MDDSKNTSRSLLSLLHGRAPEPSEYIKKVIEDTGELDLPIETQVSDMVKILEVHYVESGELYSIISSRITMTKQLYFRFLDLLLTKELEHKLSADCRPVLCSSTIHNVLFACSFELVNFSYGGNLKFPWILDALHISAYEFCKIIEVVVRADECLSRVFVKHLNRIEEMILEELAWRSGSPLWISIYNSNLPVPKSSEVVPEPIRLLDGNSPDVIYSPRILNDVRYLRSPGRHLFEKFMSPIPSTVIRNLNSALSGCSDLKSETKSSTNISSVEEAKEEVPPKLVKPCSPEKPLRSGSFSLFLRKFYLLSAERMRNLCNSVVGLTNVTVRQKMWEVYQHVVTSQSCMLIDRHLDQIMLCSVYSVLVKSSSNIPLSDFITIYYKVYPSNGSITESVILGPEMKIEEAVKITRQSMQSRGNLESFYQDVFLPKMKTYLNDLKILPNESMRSALSPIICSNSLSLLDSPRRKVLGNQNLFIRNIQPGSSPLSNSPGTRSFTIMNSPINALEPVTCTITKGITPLGKRMINDSPNSHLRNVEQVKNLLNERARNYTKVRKSE